jgi:hypothetical protein
MAPPPRRDFAFPKGRGLWLVLAAMIVAVAVAVAIGLAVRGNEGTSTPPPRTPAVEQVPAASDPAGQARNFADWLREHSR